MQKTFPEGTDAIRDYYDHNTRRFLRWGKDEGTFNIHGALWAPGVTRLKTAMDYANELVCQEAKQMSPPAASVLDLGCGVGSGLFYIRKHLASFRRGFGISISPVQIDIALGRARELNDSRLHFATMNFLDAGNYFKDLDFAYSIEAFGHASDADTFFGQVAKTLRPGGFLVIIDDTQIRPPRSKWEEKWLQRYRLHWLLPSVLPEERVLEIAGAHGFELNRKQDLTPWLRLRRPRDRFVSLFVALTGLILPRFWYGRALLGGDAKQKCYLAGMIQYRMWIFSKNQPNE